MIRSRSCQVNFQDKKSNRTRPAFWIMKMSSRPSPLSEALAPAPSRRHFAEVALSLGLSWTMTALLCRVGAADKPTPHQEERFTSPTTPCG
jgi:hypothetical protein